MMKASPVIRALDQCGQFRTQLVHTGQHYDPNMSDVFLQQLGMPSPDANLGVPPGSPSTQLAEIMLRFEAVVAADRPDWVIVYGDVTSTIACALVCNKLGIKVAHVEAGLRSYDRTMPEEVNRVLTDQIADVLFTSSPEARGNLHREGVPDERIVFAGNVMIDTLIRMLDVADASPVLHRLPDRFANGFVLVTLHRPGNVDDPVALGHLLSQLNELGEHMPVLFPVHPRTAERMRRRVRETDRITLIPPVGYLEFLDLMRRARVVITDSGGVQEETSYLGIPCLTLRPNTERPITIELGTNRLLTPGGPIVAAVLEAAGRSRSNAAPLPLWDGHAAERISEWFCASAL